MTRLIAIAAALLCSAASTVTEPFLVRYLGGSGTDDCDGVATDRAGDIYLACHSDSPDFPHLPPKVSPTSNASMDAVIVKIDGRSGQIVWATRSGGSDWDAGGDLVVGHDGSVYVLGQTQSADFPTTPDAVQRRFGGPRRAVFLLKLDRSGKVVYSTLLGGSKNDEATTLALAEDGAVFVGGTTWSDDFPGRKVAQFGPGGGPDGFVARLRPGDPASLQMLRIGGTGRDPVNALALDNAGNLFVGGATSSSDFPVRNAIQAKLGGKLDGFLMKLRIADWSLLSATYLGGSNIDAVNAIALDRTGNPIVSGTTASSDFPTTQGAFQSQLRGTSDAFLTKLDRESGHALWSTHYGGSAKSATMYEGGGMAVDEDGRIWLAGMTAASDLPVRDAFQHEAGGGDMDGFLAAFSRDGAKLCYATYIGGESHDILEDVAVWKGKLYASGLTASRNLKRMRPGFGGGPFDALVIGLDTRNLPK